MMHWFLRFMIIGLFIVSSATAGSLDAPAPPDSAGSAMYNLEQIYQILTTGDPSQITKRQAAFAEPKNGPTVSSGFPDLIEIYNAAPKYHENAASPQDVVPDKYFWGLGKGGAWGLLKGSPSSSITPSPVLKTGQNINSPDYDTWKGDQDDAFWANQNNSFGFHVGIEASNDNGERFAVQKKPVDQKDDGTVVDKKTGLMWTQHANYFGASMTWTDALNSVKNLNNLPYGCTTSADVDCYTDWRLPNIKELQSLVDYGHSGPAMPEKYEDAFITLPDNSVKNYYYWSSTTKIDNPYASAWALYMMTGMVTGQSKNNPCYVWPVRDGKE